mmetsp:Transcript_64667/g.104631  ORF Transcript_64667/g.104631 Transcript_64667/m.104631 type:complete len:94 (+) Transcript_64667:169-450(+)
MFADLHHLVAFKTSLVMDDKHHFEGYTRADGEVFDGGVTGFKITNTFEGPGTWYNKDTDSYEASSFTHVATDQYISTAKPPCRLGDRGCDVGW